MYPIVFAALISSIYALPTQTDPQLPVKIAGGRLARIEDYPYQVSLIYIDSLLCGGTILSKVHVLTAAHCIFLAQSSVYVRSGSPYWNLGGTIHRIVANSTYGRQLNEDVAVLRVWPSFSFDDSRDLITTFYHGETIEDGTMGTVVGWGSTGDKVVSNQLRSVDLPYISPQKCQEIFKDTVIGKIMEGALCAGYFNYDKNACQGDSGGPLVIDDRQAGIVSLGQGCGKPNSPVVFIDVAYYNNWILEQISVL